MVIGNTLLSFIFPHFCVSCGKLGNYFCTECTKVIVEKQTRNPICPICTKPAVGGATHVRCQRRYGLDGLVAPFSYKGPIKKAIKLFKYRRVSTISHSLVCLVQEQLEKEKNATYHYFYNYIVKQRPTIIPIPIHWWRKRKRWFNQAEILADSFATKWGLKIDPNMLIRSRSTTPQSNMKGKRERSKNIRGSFSLNPECKPSDSEGKAKIPKTLVLLDDIWTTGATMREAARLLKRKGVKKVWGITIAR